MVEIVYISILLWSAYFGSKSQKQPGGRTRDISFLKLVLSFLPLWLFMALSKPGTDYENYSAIIESVSWDNPVYGTSEIVFNYLCVFLKTISGGNIDRVIFLIRTLTIVIVYLSFYKLRSKINIGYAVLIYGGIHYLISNYTLNMSLAASLELLSFSVLYTTNRKVLSYLLSILGGLFHISGFIALLLYLVISFSLKKPNLFSSIKWFYLSVLLLFVFSLSFIVNDLQNRFEFFHYAEYLDDEVNKVGFKVIVEYVLLFFAYINFSKISKDQRLINVFYIFITATLFVSFLSYRISVGSRLLTVLMAQNVVIIPQVVKLCKRKGSIALCLNLYILIEIALQFVYAFYGASNMSNYQFLSLL